MCILEISFKNLDLDNLTTMIVGFGAVFVLLLLISFCISLLKYLPGGFGEKDTKEESASASRDKAETVSQMDSEDNKALIAVITAAIHAFNEEKQGPEGPRDQYVVRSIRRVSR